MNADAFSSGQIGSKIWLCEELEKISAPQKSVVWLLGGWYGMAGFLLLSRGKLQPRAVRSFDIDTEACRMADTLNENWVWREWMFKAFAKDANDLEFAEGEFGPTPQIVINTSTEHFESQAWFNKVPAGTIVVVQSTDMEHHDHHAGVRSLGELKRIFPLAHRDYEGSLRFEYPNHQFTRFMLIGRK